MKSASGLPRAVSALRARHPRERVDGILLLDKAVGQSSNHAMLSARRLLQAAKAGHGGTLDPMASGLLPVLLGEATKFAADLLEADKTYEAELTLGQTSSTGDAEGEIAPHAGDIPDREVFQAVLRRFEGPIRQMPPMHSALKHAGRPLYEYARAGQEVERQAREVTIRRIDLLAMAGNQASIRVSCSKGTYIRTLAQDIGAAAGCGAWLSALRRVAAGRLQIDHAISLAALDELSLEQRRAALLPLDTLLSSLSVAKLEQSLALRFAQGQRIRWLPPRGESEAQRVAVYGPTGLLGVAMLDDGLLTPVRLVADPSAANQSSTNGVVAFAAEATIPTEAHLEHASMATTPIPPPESGAAA